MHRGFSIVEALMTVAILLILAGLALPSLSRARDSAQLMRHTVRARDNCTLITLYADSNEERYPIGDTRPISAALYWWKPLVEVGLLESSDAADPEWSAKHDGPPRYAMSWAMTYDANLMTLDTVVPYRDARTSPVRQSQVVYPSDKGLMWQWWLWTGEWRGHWCCAPITPSSPIVMADLSAEAGEWPDYVEGGRLVRREGVGGPIESTWNGVRGRDRR